MDYTKVTIEGYPTVAYQGISDNITTFYDVNGVVVPVTDAVTYTSIQLLDSLVPWMIGYRGESMSNTITKLAFLQRFTQQERINIRLLSKTTPAIEDWLAILDAAQFIDLSDPSTIAGVNALENLGLLDAGRANWILTSEVQVKERP